MTARAPRIPVAIIALLLAIAIAPAAHTATAKTFGGLVPDIPPGGHAPHSIRARAATANLPYHGGPVMHSNRTHVIFWTPAGSPLTYDPGYQQQVTTFLARVARDSHKTTNVYSLSGQYRDASGPAAYDSTYAGAFTDTQPLPANGCTEPPGPAAGGTGPGWTVCLSDQQLVSELHRVTSAKQLPVSARDLYFLVLPAGFGVCEGSGPPGCALGGSDDNGSFCGYHFSDGALLYAVIPYNAVDGHCQSNQPRPNLSTADPTISTVSHEHNEAVTDPTGTGWVDGVNENGDLCIDMTDHPPPALGGTGTSRFSQVIGGAHYWLQEEWSNADHSCQAAAQPSSAAFRAPSAIRTGQTVTFTASARTGRARPKAYDWFFGSRGRGRGRVFTHAFTAAGAYRLVLRVTDTWGNWAYAVRNVTVTKTAHAKSRRSGRARRQHRR